MAPTRVADLTLDELRQLLREELRPLIYEVVHEAIEAAIDEQDFDESTNFAPEVESQLRQFVLDRPRGKPVDDLMNELGLNE